MRSGSVLIQQTPHSTIGHACPVNGRLRSGRMASIDLLHAAVVQVRDGPWRTVSVFPETYSGMVPPCDSENRIITGEPSTQPRELRPWRAMDNSHGLPQGKTHRTPSWRPAMHHWSADAFATPAGWPSTSRALAPAADRSGVAREPLKVPCKAWLSDRD
jgi:hypothetical protein